MALALTEKVRGSVGGKAFRVYQVLGLSSGANVISASKCDLDYIDWAVYTPVKATISAGSTTLPVLKTSYGKVLTLSGIDTSADNGTLQVWGT